MQLRVPPLPRRAMCKPTKPHPWPLLALSLRPTSLLPLLRMLLRTAGAEAVPRAEAEAEEAEAEAEEEEEEAEAEGLREPTSMHHHPTRMRALLRLRARATRLPLCPTRQTFPAKSTALRTRAVRQSM